jgi:predicted  nucleic acid-binding Zn-ribbon protein
LIDENDIAPSFSFTEAANAAIDAVEPEPEAAPEAPEVEEAVETEAVEEEPAAEEQPRDDAGRFAPKDDPLARELEQLRKRLADKDEFISRQGNEIGELRQAFEQRFDTLEQNAAKPHQAITGDLIDRDPATATRLAWEQQDQAALGAAFEAWKMEDPASAGAWAAYTAAEQNLAPQIAQVKEAYEARISELEQRLAPVAQANVEQQRAQEVRALTAEIPQAELEAFLTSDQLAQLATEFALEDALADPARQVSAIKNLFYVHRGRNADTLNRTVQEVARASAEQAEQATADAYVASATTATATTAVNKTEGELVADRMISRFAARSTDNGWDGR